MALVPVIQPPIMRLLTSKRERAINMTPTKNARPISKSVRIAFPIVVTVFGGLIAPLGLPLLGTIMLGNLMRESGVVERLVKVSEDEIASGVTLLLGLAVGATMDGARFLKAETLMILGFGFLAICADTVCGVLLGKLMCWLSRGKVNPLIGAAGISAYPMAARVVQSEGLKYNNQNFLLMHAVGANTGGQIGSVMAAAIMMSILKGMGII